MTYKNVNKVILKNNYKKQEIINNWNKRNLNILGKITVVKSLHLPNITYIASVCTIPKAYIQMFKTMIYNLIWGGKNDRIKRTDLGEDYSKEGLQMIDIDEYLSSFKISWLNRLTTSTPMISSRKIIPLSYFEKCGPDFLIFKTNMDNFNCLCGKIYVSPFYTV